MIFTELRPEFSVHIIDADFATSDTLVKTVRNSGFDTLYFPTLDSAMNSMRELPPHIVLFNLESFETVAEGYLQQIRDLSPEILVVLLVSNKLALNAFQLIEKGLAYDHQVRPYLSSLDLIQRLDRAVQRLYFQFESEQLREAGPQAVGAAPAPEPAPDSRLAPIPDIVKKTVINGLDPKNLDTFLDKVLSVKDLDQAVQSFLDAVSSQNQNAPALYFKYIPHYLSLVLAQSAWIPIDKIKGIGIELKGLDPLKLPEYFNAPAEIPQLQALLKEAFRVDNFTAMTHYNDADVVGVVVLFDDLKEPIAREAVGACLRIFELAYKRNLLVKEKHALDVNDSVTGLLNRKHFGLKLDEEIARSRRISLPLSMITLDIDEFQSLNNTVGFATADSVLKVIGALLKKTTRANDILARIGPDEIALLLPHTSHMGAAVKAERIRRIIEATRFPAIEGDSQKRVTVSVGVSEYPSFANDAEGLIKSADEALFQVKQAGGNRVCLATPPPGFTPDFTPKSVQDARSEAKG